VNIAIRVDSSEKIGTGHFMRCLALATVLQQRGAQTCFLSRHMPAHFLDLLAQQGHAVLLLDSDADCLSTSDLAHAAWLESSQEKDAQESLDVLSRQSWDWLIVDHYALDIRWERVLRQTAQKILVLDDLGDRRHDCDVLVDQNFYLDMPGRYVGKVPTQCQLLLGPRFALLRDEFRELHQKARSRQGSVERILVFLGGVDAENYTDFVLRALPEVGVEDIQIDVVLGAQHPFRESIQNKCRLSGYSCHVQTSRMAELMAAADLAIGAGGTATWERCCLGVPSIAISTADNQRSQLADLARVGLVYSPDVKFYDPSMFARHLKALMENGPLRHAISSNCIKFIDGQGALRVAARIGCVAVEMRKACPDDSEAVYEWRNHPAIRAVSRSTEPIAREDHVRWFASAIEDPSRQLLIGQLDGEPIGVVRFDILNDQAEVSLYLVPDAKSACRGSDLLKSAENWFTESFPEVKKLRAYVREGNERSKGLFTAAGYEIENTLFSKRLRQV